MSGEIIGGEERESSSTRAFVIEIAVNQKVQTGSEYTFIGQNRQLSYKFQFIALFINGCRGGFHIRPKPTELRLQPTGAYRMRPYIRTIKRNLINWP